MCIRDSSSYVSAKSDIKEAEDYVKYFSDFLDISEKEMIQQEIDSLDFDFETRSDRVQNRFISLSSEPYIWDSKKEKLSIMLLI